MALTKEQKAKLLEQYAEKFSPDRAVVLLEQSALTVGDVVSFKKELSQTEGTSKVVKKRLFLQSAARSGCGEIDLGILNGSLVALSADLEDYSPLRAVVKMNKSFKKGGKKAKYSFLGGWYGKEWKDSEYVTQLANIPSKEELVGKLLYLLNYPMQATASVLDKIVQKQEKGE